METLARDDEEKRRGMAQHPCKYKGSSASSPYKRKPHLKVVPAVSQTALVQEEIQFNLFFYLKKEIPRSLSINFQSTLAMMK